SGSTALVASRRPPMPTSSTARSTPARAKRSRATAVTTSKKVAPSSVASGRTSATSAAISAALASSPSTRARSPTRCRWGLVNSPVRQPPACRAAASSRATLPLPLVPPTSAVRKARCGEPRRASSSRIVPSPARAPKRWSAKSHANGSSLAWRGASGALIGLAELRQLAAGAGVVVAFNQARDLLVAPHAADQRGAVGGVVAPRLARAGQPAAARLGRDARLGEQVREHAPQHELRRAELAHVMQQGGAHQLRARLRVARKQAPRHLDAVRALLRRQLLEQARLRWAQPAARPAVVGPRQRRQRRDQGAARGVEVPRGGLRLHGGQSTPGHTVCSLGNAPGAQAAPGPANDRRGEDAGHPEPEPEPLPGHGPGPAGAAGAA